MQRSASSHTGSKKTMGWILKKDRAGVPVRLAEKGVAGLSPGDRCEKWPGELGQKQRQTMLNLASYPVKGRTERQRSRNEKEPIGRAGEEGGHPVV